MRRAFEFGTEWTNVISSASAGANGTTLVPGNNTYGAYAAVGSPLPVDAFAIAVNVNSVSVSGFPRDAVLKLAVDPGGAGSFTGNDILPDLLCGCAGPLAGGGGGVTTVWPIRIKAGGQVGAAMAVNNATVGTGNVRIRLYCGPSSLNPPRTGSYVRAFGVNLATSSGTPFSPGLAAYAALIQVGTAIAAGEQFWSWVMCFGANQASMNNNNFEGRGSLGPSLALNRPFFPDVLASPNTAEALSWSSPPNIFAVGNPGDCLFFQAGGPAAVSAGMSVAFYGIGG